MSEKTVATVKLDSPITRGDATITEIVLRKPQSGALRGTRLQAVMEMDVASMMTVIPHLHADADPAGNGGPRPGRPGRDVDRGGPFFVAEVGVCRFADSLTVDDLVADIATIFHWPPSVTDVMPLTEVLEWRHRAIMRSGASDE
ncbi:hypothetical protein BANRA_04281 [Klebsiella pneumoniae]|nr:hypothetical protein BANRA_04281 [Klebsiella pneumoniae]